MSPITLTLCLVLTLLFAGCGGTAGSAPRLDTTSEATLKSSMEKLTAGMTEDQKRQLTADTLSITMPTMMKELAKGTARKVEGVEFFAPLNGLTAAEIHQRAEQARAAIARPGGK